MYIELIIFEKLREDEATSESEFEFGSGLREEEATSESESGLRAEEATSGSYFKYSILSYVGSLSPSSFVYGTRRYTITFCFNSNS